MSTMDPMRLNNDAVALQNEGKLPEAIELYKESQAMWESAVGADHPLVAQSLSNRASACRALNVYDEAERLFQLAIRIWAKRGWPKPSEMNEGWAERFDDRMQLVEFGRRVRS